MRRRELYSNKLTGTLPLWLGNLTTLIILDVSNNLLSGTVPDVFQALQNLTSLGLSGNGFVGTLPDWFFYWPVGSTYSRSIVAQQLVAPYLAKATVGPPITVCSAGSALTGLITNDFGPPGTQLFPGPICTPCKRGTVAPANAATYCASCSANTYASGDGITGVACPMNTVSAAGSPSAASCACEVGYEPVPGGGGACSLCAPGTIYSISTSRCTPCQAGTAAPVGAAACTVCRAGTWANASACAACPAGATSPDLAVAEGECICLAGYDATPNGSCVAASTGMLSASQLAGVVVGSVAGGLLLLALAVAAAVRRGMRRRADDARYRAVVARNEDVALGEKLGSGGFGSVYRATWRGAEVAVKVLAGGPRPPARLAASHASSSSTLSSVDPDFAREVVFLSQLRHPNIAAMYAIVLEPKPMLVMELGNAGSLQDLLARSSLASFNWLQRITCGGGVAAGVEFLHSQKPPVIHLDLKSANVVLDRALTPKICDFGISLFATKGTDSVTRGTLRYMAPEVARNQRIDNLPALDVYGLGCILHDLAHAHTGVSGAETAAVAAQLGGAPSPTASTSRAAPNPAFARAMRDFEPSLGGRLPPELSALLVSLLAVDSTARPSARDARAAIAGLAAASLTWPLDGHFDQGTVPGGAAVATPITE